MAVCPGRVESMPKKSTLHFGALLRDVVGKGLHSHALTDREREIVYLLLQGYANKEIGDRCHITEQTVKDHLRHVYQKVGVHQRTALIARLIGTAWRF